MPCGWRPPATPPSCPPLILCPPRLRPRSRHFHPLDAERSERNLRPRRAPDDTRSQSPSPESEEVLWESGTAALPAPVSHPVPSPSGGARIEASEAASANQPPPPSSSRPLLQTGSLRLGNATPPSGERLSTRSQRARPPWVSPQAAPASPRCLFRVCPSKQ